MREIPQGSNKGEWFFGVVNGKRIVCLWCPGCNALGELSATHEIADDGAVTPSVQCDCGFHDYVRLAGYSERDKEQE